MAEWPSEPAAGWRALRVCLVRSPTLTSATAVGQDAVPPLGLAYIASALRARGHELHAVDGVGEAVHQYTRIQWHEGALLHGLRIDEVVDRIDPHAEVIGISCMFSVEWPVAEELLGAIRTRFPKAFIVVGGEHVTACPEFTLASSAAIDAGVLGEGEETVVDLLDAYAAGRDLAGVAGIVCRRPDGSVARTAPRARIRAIDDVSPPDWTLFPVDTYIDNALTHGANLGRSMPILASRGCPYQCTFCSSPLMWTTRWSARRPEAVLSEMKDYIDRYGVTNFDFYDLTAIVKRSWIIEFCRLLIAEGLNITWQLPTGTRSEAIDEEVARLLFASGCRIISYAPESGSRAELARIKKKVDPDRMAASMRGARRAGLVIKTNFVFGFPGSSWRDALHTFGFMARLAALGVDDINAFPFSPYPGTELFEQLVKERKLRLDREYFRSLLSFNDPQNSISYAEFVSSRNLTRLNLAAMSFFYTLSFAMRPQRAVKLAASLLTRDTSTRFTMALANRRRRSLAMKLARQQGRDTVVIPALDAPRPLAQ
jgi:radical SAM superfamily enzyme YgiQ (UPF0313 family)